MQTKPGCKTSSLDLKTKRIVLICTERASGGVFRTNVDVKDRPTHPNLYWSEVAVRPRTILRFAERSTRSHTRMVPLPKGVVG